MYDKFVSFRLHSCGNEHSTAIRLGAWLRAAGSCLIALFAFIHAVQSEYSMVAAPLLFLPLGLIIVNSRVLPRLLGYLAFVLGGLFVILGMLVLFIPTISNSGQYPGDHSRGPVAGRGCYPAHHGGKQSDQDETRREAA